MGRDPVGEVRGQLFLTSGLQVHADRYVHHDSLPAHIHGFVELVVVMGGFGVHRSPAGDRSLRAGDVLLLRPGIWHSYDGCRALEIHNCCFNPELLQRELAWMREDSMLGRLLWAGARQRGGQVEGALDAAELAEVVGQLDALAKLRHLHMDQYRADLVGRLSLVLGVVGRAIVEPAEGEAGAHPAVLAAARLLESRPAHPWTLDEIGTELHLSPGYLARLFKAATGLPPMAYLARHRVEIAAALLLHTDRSIGSVACEVGWADPNLFARRFRTQLGMSPSAYRRRFYVPRTGRDSR